MAQISLKIPLMRVDILCPKSSIQLMKSYEFWKMVNSLWPNFDTKYYNSSDNSFVSSKSGDIEEFDFKTISIIISRTKLSNFAKYQTSLVYYLYFILNADRIRQIFSLKTWHVIHTLKLVIVRVLIVYLLFYFCLTKMPIIRWSFAYF